MRELSLEEQLFNQGALIEELKALVQRAVAENRRLHSYYYQAQREIIELQREIVRLQDKLEHAKPESGE